MKKKKIYKQALEIAVDLLCKAESCIVDDQGHCPVEVGTLGGCDQCIRRFIMKKTMEELRMANSCKETKL